MGSDSSTHDTMTFGCSQGSLSNGYTDLKMRTFRLVHELAERRLRNRE